MFMPFEGKHLLVRVSSRCRWHIPKKYPHSEGWYFLGPSISKHVLMNANCLTSGMISTWQLTYLKRFEIPENGPVGVCSWNRLDEQIQGLRRVAFQGLLFMRLNQKLFCEFRLYNHRHRASTWNLWFNCVYPHEGYRRQLHRQKYTIVTLVKPMISDFFNSMRMRYNPKALGIDCKIQVLEE